jgi:DNA-binding CsgD family transcriptional regulator
MDIRNIENFSMPHGEVEIRIKNQESFELLESNRDFITSFLEVITDRYPVAVENLKKRYQQYDQNRWHFEFLIVRGFLKCNFGTYDNRLDIDAEGNFHFEFTQCPLAGECKEWRETCFPKEETKISVGEERVMKLISEGRTVSDIAVLLCISRFTVEKHTNNILRKISKHNNASITEYYLKHVAQSVE